MLQDVFYSVIYAWTTPCVPLELSIQTRTVVASWALGIFAAAIALLVVMSWQKKAGQGRERVSPGFVILLSVAALLLGGLPVWIADRQAVVGTWADRYLFGQMLGAVPL